MSSVSGAKGLLNGFDPKMLEKLTAMMGNLNQGPDQRCSLLSALKPWLRPQRQERAEEAIRILKMIRLWEAYRKGGL